MANTPISELIKAFTQLLGQNIQPPWYANIPPDIYDKALSVEKATGLSAKEYISTYYPEYFI